MSSIDERVVQMQFDNRQFENGVKKTMKTLDDLNKGLQLTGAVQGMDNLSQVAKTSSLDNLAESVSTISSRFSVMGLVGMTAIQNITNSAVNAGKRIVSALTIDPVKMGFSEYETQINAIQTILANTESKGTTLDDVNGALDELNAYADKTIYNFTEMTRNIGTFTAAGVDLDTSVAAIKGIANLAAVSGSTSQQASTAMYQLSQALASGTVKLMDWNSVTNAGMGGQVFQDALKETARVHGIEIDKMIENEGSFRETLSNGWLTSDILTETLSKFTGDLNEEQLKTMGYTEEQIAGIVKMGKTANDAATKVKTFSQLIDTLKEAAQSGWTQTWEILVGDFEEAKTLLTKVSDTIGEMLNSSAKARNEMLQGWKDLGGREALIESIKNAFEGILGVIRPIKEAFRDIFPAMTAERLFAITEGLKTFSEKLKVSEKTANNLKRIFKGVFAIVDIFVQVISAVARGVLDIVGYLAPAGSGILGFAAAIGDAAVAVRDFLKTSDVFNKVLKKITGVFGAIIKGVKGFVSAIADAFKEFANVDTSALDGFTDKVKARFEPLTKLGEGLKKFFSGMLALLKKVAPIFFKLAGYIGDAFGAIGSKILEALNEGDFDTIFDIINGLFSGGILLGIKKFIDSLSGVVENASGFLGGITSIFDGVRGCLSAYQSSIKADTLMKIASAVALLTAALVVLSMIDSEKLTVALGAITGLFAELMTTMAIFSRIINGKGFKGILKVNSAMTSMSIAILILSFAMKNLASLDWPGVAKGLISIAALSAVLVVSAKALSGSKGKLIKGATGLIAFAIAIRLLVKPLKELGALDIPSLTKGLVSVGILMLELALFMKLANGSKMGLFNGLGILAMAAAMNILADAVGKLGALNVSTLAKGLISMALALGTVAVAMRAMPKSTIITGPALNAVAAALLILSNVVRNMGSLNIGEIAKGLISMAAALGIIAVAMKFMPKSTIITGPALLVIASALVVLSNALKNMGSMSWNEVAKGLVSLAGAMTIIAVAVNFMKSALSGAAALLVVAAAIRMFVPALVKLGKMSWGEIGKSLLYLVGLFGLLAGAGLLLKPLIPTILALSGAIALLGVGCVAIGAGFLAFSVGLTTLAASASVTSGAIVLIVSSVIGLIPMIAKAIGLGIVEIMNVIGNAGVSIFKVVTTILLSVIDAITTAIPAIVNCVGVLLDALLTFIVEYVPKIVQAGITIILGFLNGIAQCIPDIIQAATDIVIAFIRGIGNMIGAIVNAGFQLIIDFINGMANSIRSNTPTLIDAVNNLMDAVFDAIGQWVENAISGGSDLIDGMIQGVKSGAKRLWNAMVDTVSGAWDGVLGFFGIKSPSRLAAEAGMFVDEGLAVGLKKFANVAGDAAVGVGETTVKSLSDSISGIADVVDADMDMVPTIRPVVDLSDVESGASQINGMLGQSRTIGVNSANVQASAISSGINTRPESGSQFGQNGPTYNFTQNNYSPKALSKTDIYRQTKNQFSAMKGALK